MLNFKTIFYFLAVFLAVGLVAVLAGAFLVVVFLVAVAFLGFSLGAKSTWASDKVKASISVSLLSSTLVFPLIR